MRPDGIATSVTRHGSFLLRATPACTTHFHRIRNAPLCHALNLRVPTGTATLIGVIRAKRVTKKSPMRKNPIPTTFLVDRTAFVPHEPKINEKLCSATTRPLRATKSHSIRTLYCQSRCQRYLEYVSRRFSPRLTSPSGYQSSRRLEAYRERMPRGFRTLIE